MITCSQILQPDVDHWLWRTEILKLAAFTFVYALTVAHASRFLVTWLDRAKESILSFLIVFQT